MTRYRSLTKGAFSAIAFVFTLLAASLAYAQSVPASNVIQLNPVPGISGLASGSVMDVSTDPSMPFVKTYFFTAPVGSVSVDLLVQAPHGLLQGVGYDGLYFLQQIVNNGISPDTWVYSSNTIPAGSHWIDLYGQGTGTTQVGVNINTTAVTAAPEPSTWAMMILGFGCVGFVMRRQRFATRSRHLMAGDTFTVSYS